MSDDKQKPGFFSRLFGRRGEAETKPPQSPGTPAPAPGTVQANAPAVPASEGEPVLTTAAAAGQLSGTVEPTITEASPDVAPEDKLPAELKGADLQPIEGDDRPPEAPAAGRPAQEPSLTTPADAPKRDGVPRIALEEPIRTGASDIPPNAPTVSPTAPAATPAAPAPAAPAPAAPQRSWWKRLTEGLSRTSTQLSDRVTGIFTKRRLDASTLEDLEDVLIQADLGVAMATRITEAVAKGRYNKEINPDEVRSIVASEVEKALGPVAKPLAVEAAKRPYVILMVGVNGAGKTTTIGKLAAKFRAQGLKPMLAAGDTFRAAAIEQLKVWGERTGTPVMTAPQGSDAAGLAFDALNAARGQGADVLLIDTAGRLQNKTGLMAELEKIVRVIRKVDESAPHAVLLVLDATVGQNAVSQVEIFRQAAGVTGLVMTKLDGTARGGILVALADRFGLPVHFVGVGEGVDDLEPFTARDFARAIVGLEAA